MGKYLVSSFFLLFNIVCVAQSQDNLAFQALLICDTVTDKRIVEEIKSKDKINKSSFFFTQKYSGKTGLFLFEKKAKKWIVYSYFPNIPNLQTGKPVSLSKQYTSLVISETRDNWGENNFRYFILFDLKNKTYLGLPSFSNNSWENNEGHYFNTRECTSEIVYRDNTLRISRKCQSEDMDYCESCIASGTYRIQKNGLKKE